MYMIKCFWQVQTHNPTVIPAGEPAGFFWVREHGHVIDLRAIASRRFLHKVLAYLILGRVVEIQTTRRTTWFSTRQKIGRTCFICWQRTFYWRGILCRVMRNMKKGGSGKNKISRLNGTHCLTDIPKVVSCHVSKMRPDVKTTLTTWRIRTKNSSGTAFSESAVKPLSSGDFFVFNRCPGKMVYSRAQGSEWQKFCDEAQQHDREWLAGKLSAKSFRTMRIKNCNRRQWIRRCLCSNSCGFETLSRSGEQIFFSIPAAAVRFETLFLKYFSDTVPTKRDTFYHSLQYLSDV